MAWDRPPIAGSHSGAAADRRSRGGRPNHGKQSRRIEAAGEAQRGQAVRGANQAVQLHPELPRRAVRHPVGADPERFHLIAPYETDPRKWLALPWIDQYSGKQYRISTTLATSTRQIARVKSYGDVLEEYEFTKRPSVPMPAARRAASKPWGCYSDGT